VIIPPAEWFVDPLLADEGTTELQRILERLLGETDEMPDLRVRSLGDPGDPSRVRQHSRSPVEELGRDSETPSGHARIRIVNGFQRHVTELVFRPAGDDEGEAIKLILPPEATELLTLPAGSYALHRQVWYPHADKHVTIRGEYDAQTLRAQWAYEMILSSTEEDRLGRELERMQPVTWTAPR